MTLIHLNGLEKKKRRESFAHLQSWQKAILEGRIESALLLKMVQASVCRSNAPRDGCAVVLWIFVSDDCIRSWVLRRRAQPPSLRRRLASE